MQSSSKIRLDMALLDLKVVSSRSQAQSFIMAGLVLVNEQTVDKAGYLVNLQKDIIRLKTPPRYVSRGGLKLEHALKTFDISPEGLACLDVGASTGGFTDCLLQAGADSVLALDVGYNQLDWRIRQDPRVTVLEKTNSRHWQKTLDMPGFQLVVVDVSFISLLTVLPNIIANLANSNNPVMITLLKPQFEFLNYCPHGSKRFDGVVRARKDYEAILNGFGRDLADKLPHWQVMGATPSPITGPKGNQEFLLWLQPGSNTAAVNVVWADVLNQAFGIDAKAPTDT